MAFLWDNIHQRIEINMKEIYGLVINGDELYSTSAADIGGMYKLKD